MGVRELLVFVVKVLLVIGVRLFVSRIFLVSLIEKIESLCIMCLVLMVCLVSCFVSV